MTREEAIERMKIIKGDCYIIDNPKDKEAFDMSIFALEQEPCELLIIKSDILLHQDDRKKWMDSIKREKENGVIILPPYFTPLLVPNDVEIRSEQPCDDAIDRAEAMTEIMMFAGNVKPDEEDIYIKVSDAVQLLRELPSVTQKSGKWINDKDDMPTCSECGYIPQYDRAIDDYEYSNYCPSCGAKMVEPQESEG